MSRPVLRVRKSGALLIAALIAFVGTTPVAGARWQLAPILLIPLAVWIWAWRAGTDVNAEGLRVRALLGSTKIPWSRIVELAPDARDQVNALLTDGKVIRLTGVTTKNLPAVIAAGGQELIPSQEPDDDREPADEPEQPGAPEVSAGDGSVPVDHPVHQRLPGSEPA